MKPHAFFLSLLSACVLTLSAMSAPADSGATNPPQAPTHSIALSFDLAGRTVLGTSRITLPPGTPLVLHCGPLEVTGGVLEEDDTTPLLVKPGRDNIIRLPASDRPRRLFISWRLVSGRPPTGDNRVDTDGITLAGFWHPLPERDMLYSVEAVLPAGFTGITEASEISEQKDGNVVRFRSSFAHPLPSIHFVAGPYLVRSRKVSGLTLFTYFFPEDASLAREYLEKAAGYIQRYEQLIGPFPYRRYTIVENRLPTGYGMPTFTLLGQAVVRLPFIKDTSLGHEILHSWFGNSIFLDPDSGNWCEGLTTYLADQRYAADRGEGALYRKEQLLRYDAYVHADNTMSLAGFRNASDSQPMAKKVRAIGYDKGAMVFHMLEKRIGTEKFRRGLQALYSEMRWKQAGWKDIEQIFTRTAATDLAPFFNQWLTRPDIPDLAVRDIVLDQDKGEAAIRFHLLQKTENPYRLDVPVRIRTLTGTMNTRLATDSADKEFTLHSEDLPTELIIDPDYDLMRRPAAKEIPPAWERFAGAARRKVVLTQDEDQRAIYAPLVSYLEKKGAATVPCSELKNSELAGADYLFAGSCDAARTLYADPEHPGSGFTLDVRSNPLAPERTMVLVSSSSAQETRAALPKIRHYGKYGYLHFEAGRIRDKRIRPSDNGMIRELLPPPSGIPVRSIRDFDAIIDDLAASRVVYAGEHHTDFADHMLQLQIIQALHARDPELAIGLEMFPRSSQQALDRYISGEITDEREFLKASRYFSVWGYDYRMYRDIIEYARKHAIPLVALNLDKEIVSSVFKKGSTDSLTPEQRRAVAAERDLDLPGYRQRLDRARLLHKGSAGKDSFPGFIQAQAMWDETMAESIVRYLNDHPEKRMVVIAGSGHVYKDSAIPPRVARRMPVRQSVVIADNGMQSGREEGSRVDYLMFVTPMSLEPAGKIGIMLKTEQPEQGGQEGRMRIVGISPHGKAGKAGLEKGDIILAIDGRPVHSMDDLKIGLMGKKPGDHVRLAILRARPLLPDETLDLDVELSSPESTAMMLPPGHPRK
ncbi:MAG TPA: PDZ domain-containing protein [Desulfobulbus sp.]|nr:PDZ domain-containing protein [Desulfobulbus sp.]